MKNIHTCICGWEGESSNLHLQEPVSKSTRYLECPNCYTELIKCDLNGKPIVAIRYDHN